MPNAILSIEQATVQKRGHQLGVVQERGGVAIGRHARGHGLFELLACVYDAADAMLWSVVSSRRFVTPKSYI